MQLTAIAATQRDVAPVVKSDLVDLKGFDCAMRNAGDPGSFRVYIDRQA
jgi:hypothetical protein